MADFTLTRGDSRVFTVTVYQADGVTVQDLTGTTIWMTAKRSKLDSDAQAVFQKKTGSGITVAAPLTGVASVAIASADTEAIGAGTPAMLFYDVRVKLPNGQIFTVAAGVLTIAPDITQATT